MDFPSVNYFCENIRASALIYSIDDFVDIVFENNKQNMLQKKINRNIFDLNKDLLRYLYNLLKEFNFNADMIKFLQYPEKKKFIIFSEEIIKNRDILKIFPYYNKKFTELMIKLSVHCSWGIIFLNYKDNFICINNFNFYTNKGAIA